MLGLPSRWSRVIALLSAATALAGSNTAYGDGALSNDGGTYNSAFGNDAMGGFVFGGSFNTGVGAHALLYNTSNYNTATGYDALEYNNGSQNTATGAGALITNRSDSFNTATGAGALQPGRTHDKLRSLAGSPRRWQK